nr:MAG: putative RNA-dependent RNA polymerase [Picobirnavirus sp.]
MKYVKLTQSQLATIASNSGMKRYLESLLEGKDFTPRSWLYEDLDPDVILDKWIAHLSTLENSPIEEESEVFQFDISQKAKWGPQGGVRPISELSDIIEEGFRLGTSPIPDFFKSDAWRYAKQYCIDYLTSRSGFNLPGTLRPASFRHVVDDMRARDTLESNSGWPLFTRRNKPEVIKESIRAAQSYEYKDYPAIALFRNYNNKTRLVWMFPMSTNLVEGSYLQPLQSALMKVVERTPVLAGREYASLNFYSPWIGFERVREWVTSAYDNGMFLTATDFSSTDAHFNHWATSEVCDVIEHAFQPEFRDGLRGSMMHMHKIPLIVGPDRMLVGAHGVSSGSNWTNFVETVFDWIVQVAYRFFLSDERYVRRSRILPTTGNSLGYAIGDDMTWMTEDYSEDFASELEEFAKLVGQIVKAEKASNSRDKVKSLQRLFQRGYRRPQDGYLRAVYPTVRALKSLVFPERFHDPRKWSKDMFAIRCFMILENCVDHPLFVEFVRFVCAGNPYLTEFAKKSGGQQNELFRQSKLLPGLNPTYNQERRDSSIRTFESIRIAREL